MQTPEELEASMDIVWMKKRNLSLDKTILWGALVAKDLSMLVKRLNSETLIEVAGVDLAVDIELAAACADAFVAHVLGEEGGS